MDLERISVTLRPRTSWEAIDLGLQLVRRFFAPVYTAWLILFLPLTISIHLVLGAEPGIAFVVIWWLRPLFDRAVLAVLGPAVFGAAPKPAEILRGLPTFFGQFMGPRRWMSIFASLTWRRFAPWRSYLLPVDQLEMLDMGPRRERVAVLARSHRDVATGLSLLCLALEGTLYFAIIIFALLLKPDSLQFDLWNWLFESGTTEARVAHVVLYSVAHSIVEPLFVAGGFGLYLNRRIELEGWDLELAFRRLASRRAALVGAALVLIGVAFSMSGHAKNQEPVDPQAAIRSVLSGDEFQDFDEEWVWRFKRDEPDVEVYEPDDDTDLQFLEVIGNAFAKLMYFLGIVVLLLIVFFIVRALINARAPPREGKHDSAVTPSTLFGLDLRAESLPEDIVAAARAAWPADPRLAFSLLYRGALGHLVHRRGFKISESATEGECVALVRRGQPDLAEDFATLTFAWQRLAYGDRIPTDGLFNQLADRWEVILRAPSEVAA
ncbi:MAG: DUF4129 domain-containing protein [Myxococcota bacterium]